MITNTVYVVSLVCVYTVYIYMQTCFKMLVIYHQVYHCMYTYMMQPPRSPPPPPQWVWVYRSYVPRPPLWVGRGWGGLVVVSSSQQQGWVWIYRSYVPRPPVVWWGCGTAYIYICLYVCIYICEYMCIYICIDIYIFI